MGERLLCKQEVIGSIPFTSINWNAGPPEGVKTRPRKRAWFFFSSLKTGNGSRRKGHTADDLASAGEEGRGRLRKATGSRERA